MTGRPQVKFNKSAALMALGGYGMVYGRNVYQHQSAGRIVAALMAMIHKGASGEEAWDLYMQP